MAEEASELAQAALKLRRALDGTNPTPKSVAECRNAFEEEYADVVNCIIALDMDDVAFDRMTENAVTKRKSAGSLALKTKEK